MVILVYFLVVFFTVSQSTVTKLYNRRGGSALVFNALKGATALVLFAVMALVQGFTFHLPTLFFGIAYGALLSVSMISGYKALCLGPMALTSMLVSFSVVIPLLWGLTAGEESLSPLRIVALCLLLCTILLTNADKFAAMGKGETGEKRNYGLWLLLVLTTFLSNGVSSILQKQHQVFYPESYSAEFMFFAMAVCALVYVSASLFCVKPALFKETRGKLFAAYSGVANGLASFFTLVLAGMENATVLFPIISAGTLLGVLLCGRFILKEKLRINHYLALALGAVAVVLLKL